jgi:hypothetical protein
MTVAPRIRYRRFISSYTSLSLPPSFTVRLQEPEPISESVISLSVKKKVSIIKASVSLQHSIISCKQRHAWIRLIQNNNMSLNDNKKESEAELEQLREREVPVLPEICQEGGSQFKDLLFKGWEPLTVWGVIGDASHSKATRSEEKRGGGEGEGGVEEEERREKKRGEKGNRREGEGDSMWVRWSDVHTLWSAAHNLWRRSIAEGELLYGECGKGKACTTSGCPRHVSCRQLAYADVIISREEIKTCPLDVDLASVHIRSEQS